MFLVLHLPYMLQVRLCVRVYLTICVSSLIQVHPQATPIFNKVSSDVPWNFEVTNTPSFPPSLCSQPYIIPNIPGIDKTSELSFRYPPSADTAWIGPCLHILPALMFTRIGQLSIRFRHFLSGSHKLVPPHPFPFPSLQTRTGHAVSSIPTERSAISETLRYTWQRSHDSGQLF